MAEKIALPNSSDYVWMTPSLLFGWAKGLFGFDSSKGDESNLPGNPKTADEIKNILNSQKETSLKKILIAAVFAAVNDKELIQLEEKISLIMNRMQLYAQQLKDFLEEKEHRNHQRVQAVAEEEDPYVVAQQTINAYAQEKLNLERYQNEVDEIDKTNFTRTKESHDEWDKLLQDQQQALTAKLQKVAADPNASESSRAEARKILDEVSQLEKSSQNDYSEKKLEEAATYTAKTELLSRHTLGQEVSVKQCLETCKQQGFITDKEYTEYLSQQTKLTEQQQSKQEKLGVHALKEQRADLMKKIGESTAKCETMADRCSAALQQIRERAAVEERQGVQVAPVAYKPT